MKRGNESPISVLWAERPKRVGPVLSWLGQASIEAAQGYFFTSNSIYSNSNSNQVQTSEIHRDLIIFDKIINIIS
jgi:hypothetical protein